jgi:pimeloyl-ACP methyl ester carboxylesterase
MAQDFPVVLIPGLLCDGALWDKAIKGLAGQMRPHIADITGAESIPELARQVLAAAPRQFGLVGLSMGGYVAFEIMRQAPERVLKLCLFDTSARPDAPEQRERRQALLALAKSGQFKGVTPRLLPLLIHPANIDNKDLTATVMAMAERVGRDAFQRQQTAILNRVDSRPLLRDIKCPAMMVVGDKDALTPPDFAREIADGILGCSLHIVPDAGHLPPLEQPEASSQLMARWLAL